MSLQNRSLQCAASITATLVVLGCSHSAAPPATASATTASAAPMRFSSPYSYEWFVRAELLFARGHYEQAAQAYRTALADAEEDALIYARLALALDAAGDAAGAKEALQAGLELDARSEAVWLTWGAIARKHGEFEAALHALQNAERAAPSSPEGSLALADLLREHGHQARAVAVLEALAARHPANTKDALRARLALAAARGDGNALAEAATAWHKGAGGDGALVHEVAAKLFAQGDAALAWRMLQALPASDEDARLRLQVLLALEEHTEIGLLLAVTPPTLLGGPVEVAEAYLRIGRAERALQALDEEDAGTDSDPYRRAVVRGEALLMLDRPGEAALLLAKVPRESKSSERANAVLRQALDTAGLPELAREVEAAQAASE